MARAIAGATISFGLVSIPVKLYSATQASAGVSFNLLHAKCGTRVKQQYICPRDNELVARDEMVKGYEIAKDQYVTFTPEELKALEERATEPIDIAQFVPVSSIDPVYFDKAYYLSAEKGGEKAYMLLTEAMRESGRAALARYAARGKQYLVMVRPTVEKPGGLVLQQLLYADEVRPLSEVPLPDGEVREPELKLARQLIDQIASETFEPTLYHDDVRERVQSDIQRKMQGQDIATSEPEPQPARIIDLMEALKASLASAPQPAAAEHDDDRHDADRKGAHRGGAAASSTNSMTKAEPKRRAAKR
ncbi:MAG TPA: Ku protein [Polyangia bacterium]|nr:Ku protein [Polyangia bacterium]